MSRVRSEICGVCSNSARTMTKQLNVITVFSGSMLNVSRCQLNNIRHSAAVSASILSVLYGCVRHAMKLPVLVPAKTYAVLLILLKKNIGLDDAHLCPSGSNSSSAGCPGKISCNKESNPDEASSNYSQSEKRKKISAPICCKYRRVENVKKVMAVLSSTKMLEILTLW